MVYLQGSKYANLAYFAATLIGPALALFGALGMSRAPHMIFNTASDSGGALGKTPHKPLSLNPNSRWNDIVGRLPEVRRMGPLLLPLLLLSPLWVRCWL